MVLFHIGSSYSILSEVSWKMSQAARICEQQGFHHRTDFTSETAE